MLNAPGWTSVSATFRKGIEVRLQAEGQKLKYSFHLNAGVAPHDLVLNFAGADDVEILADGGLKISKGESHILDAAPVAWQDGVDGRDYVEVAFELLSTPGLVALRVGEYDPTRPLIVDPEMLLFCGFLGGGLREEGRGIGVDSRGDLFITGFTESPDLPVHNAWQTSFGGGRKDVWIAKISHAGELRFLTFLGGDHDELPYDLSMDPDGNAYIAGGTASTNFPFFNGPDSVPQGSLDCFVTKINNNGVPVYSGTFGGTEFDSLRGNYADALGNHYVIGRSFSDDGSFPVVGGPSLTHSGGLSDVIVAKISPDGSTLMFAGFIGGIRIDYGRDIIADEDGFVYTCGWTNSDHASFPTLVGPDLTYNGGDKDYGMGWFQYGDAWTAKFSPDGTTYSYIGYIGGARADAAFSIVLDEQNRAILAGHTSSDQKTFPVAVGPRLQYVGNFVEDLNPYGDMWVGRLQTDGAGLEFCGYIGGIQMDRAWRMARGKDDGALYLVGNTTSPANTLIHLDAGPRAINHQGGEGILVRVDSEGRWVDYTTLFSGEGKDLIRDVVVGPGNRVHVVGWSESPMEFPTVGNNWAYGGNQDAFVATLPAFHRLIRAGNLLPDPVTEKRPVVLSVNGTSGEDFRHEVSIPFGKPLQIAVDSPTEKRVPFAIYMIPREATPADAFHLEYDGIEYGTSTFVMPPLQSNDPGIVTLANGFEHSVFGKPVVSGPFRAPSEFSWSPPSRGTYTLQGIIADVEKLWDYSLTNAVVVHIY